MKWLLDSGDPDEYRKLQTLAQSKNDELWGSTTNPSLIAKKLSGKKLSQDELYSKQKELVLEIIKIVPGAVSAEVYADTTTTASEMVKQGSEIATWHERVVVKLPTTTEGFKARTELRKQGVVTNNTLVFSQEQIFAICLHEKLIQQLYQPKTGKYPSFISPFVGRLDDKNLDGMMLVEYGMKIKEAFDFELWMLEASVRRPEHIKRGSETHSELITVPAKILEAWLNLSDDGKDKIEPFVYAKSFDPIEPWTPPDSITSISDIEDFQTTIESGELNIQHELTDTGIDKFAADLNALIV